MLSHSLEGAVILFSLWDFTAPALDGKKEGGIKGIKSKKGATN